MKKLNKNIKAVVIGGSAGAVEILTKMIPQLPESLSVPIMIVVHLPADKKSIVADLLDDKSNLHVKEVSDKETMEPGTIYFAPPDYHMLVEHDGSLSLSVEEPVMFSRPSIDVLFETAADAYGKNLLGVLLSGANHDGSSGLKSIYAAGGSVIVQDPQEASSKMMPKSGIKAVPDASVLSRSEIADILKSL